MFKINKQTFHYLAYSIKLVHASSKFYLWISLVPTIINSILPLATVFLIKLVIDETIAATTAIDKDAAFYRVFFYVVITGLVFLVGYINDSIDKFIKETRYQLYFDFIYNKVQKKTATIDLAYFDDGKYYDLFSRALENAQLRPLNVVTNALHIIQSAIALIGLGFLLIYLHSSILIILIIATLPLALVNLKFSRKIYKWTEKNTYKARKTWDVNKILTDENYALELRLFSLKNYFLNLYKTLRLHIRTGYIHIFRKRMLFEIGAQVIAITAVFSAFVVITYKTVYGVLTVGALTMYLFAIQKGVHLFNSMFYSLITLYEDTLYVDYLEKFLNIKNKEAKYNAQMPFPKPFQKSIEFKDVSFSYPFSKRDVIKNVDIKINAGTTVALVGVNGSGKTTLIKLLSKFFEPDSGEILIDGININDINTEDLRNNMSALFQNFAHYNFSATENIIFGDKAIDRGYDAISQAAKKARIHDFLKSLPKGYDTILGKIYNESEELSIGQWQKIGLARAFYKDSPIVILDEPTASMDPEAEYKTFKIFKEIMAGKTAILISHRFSTVQMADYIYVLGNESVLEQGTHKKLLKLNGYYAEMYNKQAIFYK